MPFFIEIMDRTIAPKIYQLQNIKLAKPQQFLLKNNCPIIFHVDHNIEIIKLEIVFAAGSKYEIWPGQTSILAKVFAEGTSINNNEQIAEKFSLLGYYYEFSNGVEYLTVSLTGLKIHFNEAIELLYEIIVDPIFPKSQVQKHVQNSIQSLQINQQKTSYKASTEFRKLLFGENHYLGKIALETDFEKIDQEKVVAFYRENISNKPFTTFLTGSIDDTILQKLNDTFGTIAVSRNPEIESINDKVTSQNGNFYFEMPQAKQNSLRIGMLAPHRTHSDFWGFFLANFILGGYFGSRLMKNIREDKGLTYGINSSYQNLKNIAYWVIQTDLHSDNTQLAINEIEKEINFIKTSLIPNDELLRAKNTILGEFYGSFNTSFDILDKYKALVLENIDIAYYENFVDHINKVTAKEIQSIANKYLNLKQMIYITTGQKK